MDPLTGPIGKFIDELGERMKKGDQLLWVMAAGAALGHASPEQVPEESDEAMEIGDYNRAHQLMMDDIKHLATLPEQRQQEIVDRVRSSADDFVARKR